MAKKKKGKYYLDAIQAPPFSCQGESHTWMCSAKCSDGTQPSHTCTFYKAHVLPEAAVLKSRWIMAIFLHCPILKSPTVCPWKVTWGLVFHYKFIFEKIKVWFEGIRPGVKMPWMQLITQHIDDLKLLEHHTEMAEFHLKPTAVPKFSLGASVPCSQSSVPAQHSHPCLLFSSPPISWESSTSPGTAPRWHRIKAANLDKSCKPG